MSKLLTLYLLGLVSVLTTLSRTYFMSNEFAILRLAVLIFVIAASMILLYEDAKSRGLSGAHAVWGLISPLGIVIYHLFFVTGHPIKK